MILKTTSCPRCRGNVYIDEDIYGWYEECIQCGYLRFLERISEKGELIPAEIIDMSTCLNDGMSIENEQREPIEALS